MIHRNTYVWKGLKSPEPARPELGIQPQAHWSDPVSWEGRMQALGFLHPGPTKVISRLLKAYLALTVQRLGKKKEVL